MPGTEARGNYNSKSAAIAETQHPMHTASHPADAILPTHKIHVCTADSMLLWIKQPAMDPEKTWYWGDVKEVKDAITPEGGPKPVGTSGQSWPDTRLAAGLSRPR